VQPQTARRSKHFATTMVTVTRHKTETHCGRHCYDDAGVAEEEDAAAAAAATGAAHGTTKIDSHTIATSATPPVDLFLATCVFGGSFLTRRGKRDTESLLPVPA
jgi:hypothetical protein